MRRLVATVVAAGGMVVLAGCGGSPPLFPAHETATEKNCIAAVDGRGWMAGSAKNKMMSDWAKLSAADKKLLIHSCMVK